MKNFRQIRKIAVLYRIIYHAVGPDFCISFLRGWLFPKVDPEICNVGKIGGVVDKRDKLSIS